MDKRAYGTAKSRHGILSCFVNIDVKKRRAKLPVNDEHHLRAHCQYHVGQEGFYV
jgi:hypothetical protein